MNRQPEGRENFASHPGSDVDSHPGDRHTLDEWVYGAAVAILVTGGFFGGIERGMLTETRPMAAAAGLCLLALFYRIHTKMAMAPPDRGLWALILLIVLNLRPPTPHLGEAFSLTTAAIAYLAGRSMGLTFPVRRVLLLAAAVPLLVAVYQRWILFPELAPLLTGQGRSRLESGRVFSVFILPGQFSAWAGALLPLALASAFVGPWRRYAGALSGALLGAFMLAGSLSGPVAALPAVSWMIGRGRRFFTVIAVIGVAAFLSVASRPEVFNWKATTNPFRLRIETWTATTNGWLDAPLLGHGPGAFERIYMATYWRTGMDKVRHPHDWPLKIAFEHGAVGLFAWMMIASLLAAPVRDRSSRAAALAFFLASLLDVADFSGTLRMLGCLMLGASQIPHSGNKIRNPSKGQIFVDEHEPG